MWGNLVQSQSAADYLKDVAAQKAEDRRKREVLDLNQQISAAAKAAKASVEELRDAESQLTDTRTQLAAATTQATLRLNEYLASKAKLDSLEIQSKKIITVQLRMEVLADVPVNPTRAKNTYGAMNLLAYFYSTSQRQDPILFRGGQIEALAISSSAVRYVATFEPELPLLLSGANVALLDNRNLLAANVSSFFEKGTSENGSRFRLRWILIVNGAAFPLTDEVDPRGTPVNTPGLSAYAITPERQKISESYASLFQ